MNYNASAPIEGKLYMLQPGDATRYTVMIQELDERHTSIISGVDLHPTDYVLVTIMMSGGSGSAVLLKSSLRELLGGSAHVLGYAKSHGMGAVHPYTLAACLLAASVLIDGSDGVNEAMLRAPELLA